MQAGIAAVDPARLVARACPSLGLRPADTWILAAGKGAVPMARAARESVGAHLRGGLIVAPSPIDQLPLLEVIVGEHPQPGAGSERAGRRALEIARSVPEAGQMLVLISGGASAMMAAPADGLSLEDKRLATGVLLRAGADIYALNTVRKHLSHVKGGRLAAACRGRTTALVLSDVVGDDLSVIASGPTVPDPSTYADALAIVQRFGGRDAYQPSVVAHLEGGVRGERQESPKPGDPRLARTTTMLVGGRHHAMRGAADAAAARGYRVTVIEEPVVGEARRAAVALAHTVLDRRDAAGPLCVIASGETTVRVTGGGTGGRNQELTLAMVAPLAAASRRAAFASAGTDGVDGPTDAAGAVADDRTAARAAAAGLAPPDRYLADNDSYAFFDALSDLIRTGPTATNVGDLHVFLLA